MPRNSGGTYSLPAGNPVVTGTTVSSTWANSTLADIAAELTNSLARDGSGSMDETLLLANGTAVAPSLAFASETTTGLYLEGAQDMRLQVNATNAIKMTSANVSIPLGLIVTQDTPDGSAVTGTANGDGFGGDFHAATSIGAGVRGTGVGSGTGATFTGGVTGPGVTGSGGATSGVGVVGVGTATSAGVSGAGGATAGAGVSGTGGVGGVGVRGSGGTTSGTGVVGTGTATSAGVSGTGGATSGTGIEALGGAPNGVGAALTGTGTGLGVLATGGANNAAGVRGTGGGTGLGVIGVGGASSGFGVAGEGGAPNGIGGIFTGAGTGQALQVHTGHAVFTGGNPAATTGYSNTLTPTNIVKAWGHLTTDGAGNVTLHNGFNIASVAVVASFITVTFATGMASAAFATVVTPLTTGVPIPVSAYVNSQTTTTARFAAWKNSSTDRVATVNFISDQIGLSFMVMAPQ